MISSRRHSIEPEQLARLIARRRVQVIDLRPPIEWHEGRIPRARNIELENLPKEAITLDRELPIVFYGNNEPAAADVADALRATGMTAYALAGGLDNWTLSGQSVESGE